METIVSLCPICGGQVVVKRVDEVVRGGNDVAIVEVRAGVCGKCGERLYDKTTFELLERVRADLLAGRVDSMRLIGHAYEMA